MVDGQVVPVHPVGEELSCVPRAVWHPVALATDGVLCSSDGAVGLCISCNHGHRHLFGVGIEDALGLGECAVEVAGHLLLVGIRLAMETLHSQEVDTLRHIGQRLVEVETLGVEFGVFTRGEPGFGALPSGSVVTGERGVDEKRCHVQLIVLAQGYGIEEGASGLTKVHHRLEDFGLRGGGVNCSLSRGKSLGEGCAHVVVAGDVCLVCCCRLQHLPQLFVSQVW